MWFFNDWFLLLLNKVCQILSKKFIIFSYSRPDIRHFHDSNRVLRYESSLNWFLRHDSTVSLSSLTLSLDLKTIDALLCARMFRFQLKDRITYHENFFEYTKTWLHFLEIKILPLVVYKNNYVINYLTFYILYTVKYHQFYNFFIFISLWRRTRRFYVFWESRRVH